MTNNNEKTYQNFKDWYAGQEKEVKAAVVIAGIASFIIFASGIDSIVDSGVCGFICGTLTSVVIGLVCALAFLVIYWIAAAVAPKQTEKIFNKLTEEPKEDYYDDEDN